MDNFVEIIRKVDETSDSKNLLILYNNLFDEGL